MNVNAAQRTSVLQAIRSLGDRMHAALEANDLAKLSRLAQQRGELTGQLHALGRPAEADPDWERETTRLQEQHQVLAERLAARERHVGEELKALEQFKKARRHYGTGPAPTSKGLLSDGLQG